MKKILLSLAMIGAVAAIGIGATTAYFSDTETSTGNTFTAGSIDLQIDSTQHYNGNVCTLVNDEYVWVGQSAYPVPGTACSGTWELKDLNIESDKFFNFTDVKPGDSGENTISIHVDNNDAYACFYVSPLVNADNTCTEPEIGAEPNCTLDNIGELAQNIYFFAWGDTNGNNVWEQGELPLFSNLYGPASDVLNGQTYPLGPMVGNTTNYIGLEWCAGTMTVDVNNYTVTCDGGPLGNIVQTGSMVGSVAFYVEQQRNNPNFVCPQSPFIQ